MLPNDDRVFGSSRNLRRPRGKKTTIKRGRKIIKKTKKKKSSTRSSRTSQRVDQSYRLNTADNRGKHEKNGWLY